MKYFEVEKVTDHITRITDITGVSMFLAVGEKEAALVDTGTGIGDLKEMVRSLTDKPVKVLLTHGHVDHAFGAAAFEDVFMSRLDTEILEAHADMGMRIEYANTMPLPDGGRITEDMFAPKPDADSMQDLKDGDVFDLGGLTLEIYALPGHTPGSMTVLFQEDRLLLTGDACNPATFLFFAGSPSVEEYKETLAAYRNRMKEKYDRIILSHGNEFLDSTLLDVVVETCDSVLNGTDDAVRSDFMGEEAYAAAEMGLTDQGFRRLDGKVGNIVYSRKNIFRGQQDDTKEERRDS